MTAQHEAEIGIAPVPAAVALGLAVVLTLSVGLYDSGPPSAHNATTAAMGIVSGAMLLFSIGLRYRSSRRALLMRTVASACTLVSIPLVLVLAFIDAGPLPVTLSVATVMLLTTLAAYAVYHGAENERDSVAAPRVTASPRESGDHHA